MNNIKPRLYEIKTIKAKSIFSFSAFTPEKASADNAFVFNIDDTAMLLSGNSSFIQENPLFHQIKMIRACNDGRITEDIIYVDFNDVCITDESGSVMSFAMEMRALLKYGFTLTYNSNGTEKIVHYVKSERSGSMSREKRLSFIASDLKERLESRLRLDIKPKKVVLSKWYAYNGLMLSSGTRIEAQAAENLTHFNKKGKLRLNEKSVIVVNDVVSGKDEVESNLFDGEGIISPSMAECLRECLPYDRSNARALPTSFQIRAPYMKGMLHQVDFCAFAKEKGVNEIVDCWGKAHNIADVHIIFTVSMFKGKKWFEEAVSKTKKGVMKYYFEKFNKYDHAIYVTGYNKPHPKTINLNWQVLSTPSLPHEDFVKLGQPLQKMYKALADEKDVENRRLAFLNNLDNSAPQENEEDMEEVPAETYSRYDNVIRTAVRKNPALMNTKKAADCAKNMAEHTLSKYGTGRFPVAGYNLYLSGDLLFFLYKIFGIKTMDKSNALHLDKFYAPGVKCNIETKYAVLRNPHISAKELVTLKAFKPAQASERYRYLNQLKGVLMINSSTIKDKNKNHRPSIAEHLSGADYDGDIVKLVTDETYSNALPDYDVWSAYEFTAIPKKQVNAVVINPDDGNTSADYIEESIYKMFTITFGSKIGQYSNTAFKHAVHAYNANNKDGNDRYIRAKLLESRKKNAEEADLIEIEKQIEGIEDIQAELEKESEIFQYTSKAVDELFLVLGQEIDSAKTGERPEMKKGLSVSGDNYFVTWKNAIADILKKSEHTLAAEGAFENYPVDCDAENNIIIPDKKTKLPNLYTLPYYTLINKLTPDRKKKKLKKATSKNKSDKEKPPKKIGAISVIEDYINDFSQIDFYTAEGLRKIKSFAAIVNNYNEAVSDIARKKHIQGKQEGKNNNKLEGFTKEYMCVLFAQYNDYMAKRYVMRAIVAKLRKWNLGKEQIPTSEEVYGAINEISSQWIYSSSPADYLKSHFGKINFSDDEIKLLCNFTCGGYKLLIIAMNLAYKVDFKTRKITEESEEDYPIENESDYSFEEIETVNGADEKAEEYLMTLFGYTAETKTQFFKTQLTYYSFCANMQKYLASHIGEIFGEIDKKGVFNTECKAYYNRFMKKENDGIEYEQYLTSFKNKSEQKQFISRVLLGNEKYNFDSGENFLWTVLGESFLVTLTEIKNIEKQKEQKEVIEPDDK